MDKISLPKLVKYILVSVISLTSILLLFLVIDVMNDEHLLEIVYIKEGVTPTFHLPLSSTITITPSQTVTPTITQTPTPTITSTPMPPEGEAFSIGESVEGKSINVFRFGDGSDARMIISGIHGGYEWNTSVLAHLLINDLRDKKIIVPDSITLYILPILNPDGYFDYLGSSYGRGNAHSVDLNRNWDVLWEADWPRAGCFSYVYITAGDKPFSEPETLALSQFILDNNINALISYHSAMSSIFAGGRPEPDVASDGLAQALSEASQYSYPPNDGGRCYYTGQLIDWASVNNIAAVDIELTDHESNDIVINRKVLEAFLLWEP